MIASGADIATVSKLLGHSAITTTLRVYAHTISGSGRSAVGAIDAILPKNDGYRMATAEGVRRKNVEDKGFFWSGRRESNPQLLLGRQGHYHYATPASRSEIDFEPRGKARTESVASVVGRVGFEPTYRVSGPDLQSGAFNHSTTYPRWRPVSIR